ncbi:DUF4011 domain-containing protein [Blastococcus brunescens]|uniref:DUF4011 domain-containing protein n=1 Tax=Blastococcus brunescens TaxID=1564165 RepID=A0ABZ1AU85_9ACTN|nr:DUF4011 domain-containing protein [Blastococcus sp. BMG 8361]WRL62141.1 DUF4011 domain-containing protein [Blastococcus sp. BMG 8361]
MTTARELPDEQLTELLVERRELHVDVSGAGYLPKLRNLAYKAKTVLEETGANNLYLALGSLVWELDGRPLRSPLVLIPVVLAPMGRTGSYRLSLDESGSSTPNYCLLEKLRQLHGLTVPTLTEAVDGTLDLDAAFEAMRSALVGHGLPYRVESTADLAILQFAKFRLWKDLDEHWADFTDNPLVSHLVHEPTEAFEDPARDTGSYTDLDELAAELPAPADASQLRAIAEATAGRTFVLEGPPGTGKSQTITNLLVRAVAEGKRVLFVAEKRAALDVVARRLDAVGMGMFALDLHDKGSRASMVRAQIRLALEHAVTVDEQGLAADGESLRSARRMLARYTDRLHDPNAVGLSLYSARTSELAGGTEVSPLPVPLPFAANAPAEVLRSVRVELALLPDIADLTRPSPRHPWAFVDSPTSTSRPPRRPRPRWTPPSARCRPCRSWPGCCAAPARSTSSTPSCTSSAGRGSGSTSSTRPSAPSGRRRRRRCSARSPRSPPSATPASTCARPRCCSCRWPRSTWPRRQRRRPPGGDGGAS